MYFSVGSRRLVVVILAVVLCWWLVRGLSGPAKHVSADDVQVAPTAPGASLNNSTLTAQRAACRGDQALQVVAGGRRAFGAQGLSAETLQQVCGPQQLPLLPQAAGPPTQR